MIKARAPLIVILVNRAIKRTPGALYYSIILANAVFKPQWSNWVKQDPIQSAVKTTRTKRRRVLREVEPEMHDSSTVSKVCFRGCRGWYGAIYSEVDVVPSLEKIGRQIKILGNSKADARIR